jgi:hypothetical protein
VTLAQSPLDVVLSQLRAEYGGAIVVVDQDPLRVTLRIGGHEDGIVSIEVADAAIPSFVVSYPKESQKRDGRTHVDVQVSRDVRWDGVRWIVSQLETYGLVRPEF